MRWRVSTIRIRHALAGIALVAALLAAEKTRRRWAYFREQALRHGSMEQFCRESAGTFRCPEFWDPEAAESAAREAERHRRLKRHFENQW